MPNPLRLKALLVDLNGTLHVGHDATPHAVQAIDRLRRSSIPFVFCSNSTKESSANLLLKIRGMGFQAEEKDLMTSLGACRQLVEEHGLRPYLLLSPSAKEEFAHFPSSSSSDPYDSVIIGLHEPSLSYDHLNTAFRILKSEPISGAILLPSKRKPMLIAPHTSMFQESPASDDLPAGLSLGIGPFVRALEIASGVDADIIGKPTRHFFEMAIGRIKRNHPEAGDFGYEDVGIVGDDVVNDLGEGAKELGLKRILVRTGKYRQGDEDITHPPDRVYDSFAEFADDLM